MTAQPAWESTDDIEDDLATDEANDEWRSQSGQVQSQYTPLPRPKIEYEMTVADIGSLLSQHGLDRENRTIQRWLESGKILGQKDPLGHWLADKGSATSFVLEYVATQAEVLRPGREYEDDRSRLGHDTPETIPELPGDAVGDDTTTASKETRHGRDDDETVAALKRELAEERTKRVAAEGDVQVREKMVAYMQEQFEKTMEQAIDLSREVGVLSEANKQLVFENGQLRHLLPEENTDQLKLVSRFTPSNVRGQQEE